MKLLSVNFFLFGIFLFSLHSAFSQVPETAYIKYLSCNPVTEQYSVAWYPSSSENVSSLELKFITGVYENVGGNPTITAEALQNFNNNEAGELSFMLYEYPALMSLFSPPMRISIDARNNFGSTNSLSFFHQLANLSSSISYCPNSIDLEWTQYQGHNVQIKKQTVYQISENVSALVMELGADDTTYSVNLTTESGEVCYYIETEFIDTYGNTQVSNSPKTCQEVDIKIAPSYYYPNYIETINESEILLKFRIDPATDYTQFLLYRSLYLDSLFFLVDTLNYNGENIVYTDSVLYADSLIYYYKILTLNECGDTGRPSPVLNSIVLQGEVDVSYYYNLYWNNTTYWNNDYLYSIQRTVDDDTLLIMHNQNPFYRDYILPFSDAAGRFCYKVIVIVDSDPEFRQISNIMCSDLQTKIFVPNAVNPYSSNPENRIFKPVISFAMPNDYLFQVFSRWGKKMFETEDMTAHWDGTYKDENCQQGTYTYYVRYTDSNGIVQEKRGVVNLFFNSED